ncbi:MAG TPA: hypothetical protein VJN93_12490 [Candidatus Acidoferrum sp.]|nr:hypothetical protein [Candidatus Acidoferrum sp.]
MGCQWVVGSNLKEALEVLNREAISVAILDSRCALADGDPEDRALREILVRLPGRVLTLTDEPRSPGSNNLVAKYSLPYVQRDRLAKDLWGCMEQLLHPRMIFPRIIEAARLILDSFLQPLPAGVRHSQGDERHLVYEAESLVVDLSIEHIPSTNHISLLGQILRKDKPDLPLNDVRVVLQGQRGPLELEVTNESGEFSFEIGREPNVMLEIDDRPNHCVTLVSPELRWGYG